jgi:hypothetical protein
VRRLVTGVLQLFGIRLTPEKVKRATDLRLMAQGERVKELDKRIREDYRHQDERMAGRR